MKWFRKRGDNRQNNSEHEPGLEQHQQPDDLLATLQSEFSGSVPAPRLQDIAAQVRQARAATTAQGEQIGVELADKLALELSPAVNAKFMRWWYEQFPAHVGVLEALAAQTYRQPKQRPFLHRALRAMVDAVSQHPELAERALGYALPYQRMDLDTWADPGDAAKDSAIQVALHLVSKHPSRATELQMAQEFSNTDAATLGAMLYTLAARRYIAAATLVHQLDDDGRQAIAPRVHEAYRREAHFHNPSIEFAMFKELFTAIGDDAAAAQAATAMQDLGTEYLGVSQEWFDQHGYPLDLNLELDPAAPTATTYEPIAGKAIYLLHNCLPKNSGGYATRAHGLLKGIAAQGWEVMGVTRLGYPEDRFPGTHDSPRVYEIDGIRYRYLPNTGTNIDAPYYRYVDEYARELYTLVLEERPAVIHAASFYHNGHAALKVGRALGIPVVYEIRGLWEVSYESRYGNFETGPRYEFMSRLEVATTNHADQVFLITGGVKDLMQTRGMHNPQAELLPNGVNSGRFNELHPDKQLQTEYNLDGKTVIGYIGSILDYEGIDDLVQVVAELRQERRDFHVFIVGDGSYYEQIQELVANLDLAEHVTLTGRVPHTEVERYYSVIDVIVLPRKPLELCELVSPLKPFEAMAMHKVVVAADVAALAEIVQHEKTGYLYTKGDLQSLRATLHRVLDTDGQVLTNLGGAARQWVETQRDWNILAQRVVASYNRLTGQG